MSSSHVTGHSPHPTVVESTDQPQAPTHRSLLDDDLYLRLLNYADSMTIASLMRSNRILFHKGTQNPALDPAYEIETFDFMANDPCAVHILLKEAIPCVHRFIPRGVETRLTIEFIRRQKRPVFLVINHANCHLLRSLIAFFIKESLHTPVCLMAREERVLQQILAMRGHEFETAHGHKVPFVLLNSQTLLAGDPSDSHTSQETTDIHTIQATSDSHAIQTTSNNHTIQATRFSFLVAADFKEPVSHAGIKVNTFLSRLWIHAKDLPSDIIPVYPTQMLYMTGAHLTRTMSFPALQILHVRPRYAGHRVRASNLGFMQMPHLRCLQVTCFELQTGFWNQLHGLKLKEIVIKGCIVSSLEGIADDQAANSSQNPDSHSLRFPTLRILTFEDCLWRDIAHMSELKRMHQLRKLTITGSGLPDGSGLEEADPLRPYPSLLGVPKNLKALTIQQPHTLRLHGHDNLHHLISKQAILDLDEKSRGQLMILTVHDVRSWIFESHGNFDHLTELNIVDVPKFDWIALTESKMDQLRKILLMGSTAAFAFIHYKAVQWHHISNLQVIDIDLGNRKPNPRPQAGFEWVFNLKKLHQLTIIRCEWRNWTDEAMSLTPFLQCHNLVHLGLPELSYSRVDILGRLLHKEAIKHVILGDNISTTNPNYGHHKLVAKYECSCHSVPSTTLRGSLD